MQIKTQLDIRLTQTDINDAIANYLALHGHKVSPTELEAIKYVNTRAEGVTANLTISNESDTAEDTSASFGEVKSVVKEEKDPEPVNVEEPMENEEDLVEPSTVEDVMPSIDEVASALDEVINGDAENTHEVESRSLFGARKF